MKVSPGPQPVTEDYLERDATSKVNLVVVLLMAAMLLGGAAVFFIGRFEQIDASTAGLKQNRALLQTLCRDVVHDPQTGTVIRAILRRSATKEEDKVLARFYQSYQEGCAAFEREIR